MDNVIDMILEIDEKARKMIKDAQLEGEKIILEAQEEESFLKSDMLDRADNRIEKVEQFEKDTADEKISTINDSKNKKIQELDSIYNQKHETWENDIFKAITEKLQ